MSSRRLTGHKRKYEQSEAAAPESDSGDEDIDVANDVPKPTKNINLDLREEFTSKIRLAQKENSQSNSKSDTIAEFAQFLGDVAALAKESQENSNEYEEKVNESVIEQDFNNPYTKRITPLQALRATAAIRAGDHIIARSGDSVFVDTLKLEYNFDWLKNKFGIYDLNQYCFDWIEFEVFHHYNKLTDANKLQVDPLTRYQDCVKKLKQIEKFNKFRYRNENDEMVLVDATDGNLFVETETGKISYVKDNKIKKTFLFDIDTFDVIVEDVLNVPSKENDDNHDGMGRNRIERNITFDKIINLGTSSHNIIHDNTNNTTNDNGNTINDNWTKTINDKVNNTIRDNDKHDSSQQNRTEKKLVNELNIQAGNTISNSFGISISNTKVPT